MNHLEPTSSTSSGVSRRDVLRTGGLVVSLGAIAAACGSDRSGSTDPGRLGFAPPPATLPDVTMDDLVILRTMQSVEYSNLALYEAVLDLGVLTADEQALAERIVDDHTGHANFLGTLITDNGGEQYACPNPFIMDRSVTPIMTKVADSDDPHRDALNVIQAFESIAGASYQALIGQLKDLDLRKAMITVGGEEHRHATVLARIITPDEAFSPSFFGEPVEQDADGFWAPYAIPSVFGTVSGVDLVVGARNEEGTRFATQLQTPAANTFVYEYQSC